MSLNLCPDAVPSTLNLFDLSIAPPLLFYSYIPIFFLCLFFGLFILIKDKNSSLNRYFFGITLAFAGYIFLSLLQWTAAHLEIVHLAWQLYVIPEICIFLFSILFSYAFLFGRSVPAAYKYAFGLILVTIALVLPTQFNISSFDLENCEGVNGLMWRLMYMFELGCIIAMILIAVAKLRTKINKDEKFKTIQFSVGQVFFLSIFWGSNYFGEITKTYEINLIGPFGMLLFFAMLSYLIIKFKIFNIQLFSSQLLVIALWLLTAALIFIQRIDYIHIVVLCTLLLITILGFNLIGSVKKEIQQREKIEKLAVDLEKSNNQLKELDRQKDELLGIVSHQLATPVSSVKWYTEMLMDGDLGKITKDQKEHLTTMRAVTENLSDLVSMILDVSRIQLGRMHIDKQELDLNVFFKEILEIIKPKAIEKKIKFNVSVPSKLPKAMLDKRYTHMTIENLLSNAVKYTPGSGIVNFIIQIKGKNLYCEVSDTGVGIPKAEKTKIFGKMFRASNVRNQVDGNGFGLYVAKGAVEAQGGKIWFESQEGKGTTFFIELPLK